MRDSRNARWNIARTWHTAATAVGALVLAWTWWLAVKGGGWSFRVFDFRISSRDPFRSLVVGAALLAIGLSSVRLRADSVAIRRRCSVVAGALSMATLILGIAYGSFVAGGADAYGYVSQAALWMNKSPFAPAALAVDGAWVDASWALTPLGYRPALTPGWMVPVYPPGLPIVMAAMHALAGEVGPYLVTPILGALVCWLTYLFGKELYGPFEGALSAAIMFATPVFLLQLMSPMTDVPVTAWWLASAILALRPSRRSLVLSGLAATLAVMTRPNLALLGVVLAGLVIRTVRVNFLPLTRSLWWCVPALFGPIAIGILNHTLYGSPFASGYGTLETLYSPGYAFANISHYLKWLVSTQTVFPLIGLIATPWMIRSDRSSAWKVWWSCCFAMAVLTSYIWYLPFDNWTYLRFLLPAYPMIITLSVAVLVRAVIRVGLPEGLCVAVAVVLVCFGLWQARPAFKVAEFDGRYRAAADFVRSFPSNAVVLANLHSGSIRYYGSLVTARYEWIGSDQYTAALRWFQQRSYPVYAVLDQAEVNEFRAKYSSSADVSWLDRPMMVIGKYGVRVYRVVPAVVH
jgi:Dolichyl-phosphate-mannose-protein mannosyltransferase